MSMDPDTLSLCIPGSSFYPEMMTSPSISSTTSDEDLRLNNNVLSPWSTWQSLSSSSSPASSFVQCPVCQLAFGSQETLIYHMNAFLHFPSYSNSGNVSIFEKSNESMDHNTESNGHLAPHRSSMLKKQMCRCESCERKKKSSTTVGHGRVSKKRSLAKTTRDKKTKSKERLSNEELAVLQSYEWANRRGYWCTVCNLRFPDDVALIDHMAEGEHRGNTNDDNNNNQVVRNK